MIYVKINNKLKSGNNIKLHCKYNNLKRTFKNRMTNLKLRSSLKKDMNQNIMKSREYTKNKRNNFIIL